MRIQRAVDLVESGQDAEVVAGQMVEGVFTGVAIGAAATTALAYGIDFIEDWWKKRKEAQRERQREETGGEGYKEFRKLADDVIKEAEDITHQWKGAGEEHVRLFKQRAKARERAVKTGKGANTKELTDKMIGLRKDIQEIVAKVDDLTDWYQTRMERLQSKYPYMEQGPYIRRAEELLHTLRDMIIQVKEMAGK